MIGRVTAALYVLYPYRSAFDSEKDTQRTDPHPKAIVESAEFFEIETTKIMCGDFDEHRQDMRSRFAVKVREQFIYLSH